MENKLKAYRKAAGLTQWQLAAQLNTSQARLWQWENNLTPIKKFNKQRIAVIFKVPIETIFPEA